MGLTNNPLRYEDVRVLADIAIAKGECRWKGKTEGSAKYIRRRFYQFRKLMEEIDSSTPYAKIKATVDEGILTLTMMDEDIMGGILTEFDPADVKPPQSNLSPTPIMTAQGESPAERARRLLGELDDEDDEDDDLGGPAGGSIV